MGSPAQKTFLLSSSSVQMPILLAPTFLLNIFASALGAAPQRQHTPSSAATCCHRMLSPLWHFLSLAGLHQQFLAPGGLHQGNWRVDWGKHAFYFLLKKILDGRLITGLHLLCLCCAAGVCSCELCISLRCPGILILFLLRSHFVIFSGLPNGSRRNRLSWTNARLTRNTWRNHTTGDLFLWWDQRF